jgi:hypothetical protein
MSEEAGHAQKDIGLILIDNWVNYLNLPTYKNELQWQKTVRII